MQLLVYFVFLLLIGIGVGAAAAAILPAPVAALIGLAPAAFVVWRAFTARLIVRDGQLTIRNIWRTVVVPVEDFEYATARDMRPAANTPALIVAVLRDSGGPRLRHVAVAASVQMRRRRRAEFAAAVRGITDVDDDFSTYELN